MCMRMFKCVCAHVEGGMCVCMRMSKRKVRKRGKRDTCSSTSPQKMEIEWITHVKMQQLQPEPQHLGHLSTRTQAHTHTRTQRNTTVVR